MAPKVVRIPEDLKTALQKNKIAMKYFEQLSPGYQKDFVEWVM